MPVFYNGSRRMLLMTCAIQTYDVKAAAGLLLLFCVLIPISSTCQLHLVTASVAGHTWSPCDKNASFLRGQRASPLLWHQRAAWPAFHWPLKWQISDKCTLEKALLFLPVFWGCRVSVVPIVSLISLEIVLVFLECIPRNCQKAQWSLGIESFQTLVHAVADHLISRTPTL